MSRLRTVDPYGLNDMLGDEYDKNDTHTLVGNEFTSLDFSF